MRRNGRWRKYPALMLSLILCISALSGTMVSADDSVNCLTLKRAIAAAEEAVAEAEEALEEENADAASELEAAQAVEEEAQTAVDEAAEAVAEIESQLAEAQANTEAAKEALEEAESALSSAESALADLLDEETDDLSEAAEALMASILEEISSLETPTMLSLMEYIAENEDGTFTTAQVSDAEKAITWLEGTASKASWYDDYVTLGEESTSWEQLEISLTYMDAVNAIREANNISTLGINLTAMAGAALNCYYSGNIFAHSGDYSTLSENLAQRDTAYTGSSDVDSFSYPFSSWYTEEKAIFDAAAESDSTLESYRYNAIAVATYYSSIYSSTGHYLNFVDNTYTKSFGIACGSGVTIWKGSSSASTFTIEAFQTLVNSFEEIYAAESAEEIAALQAQYDALEEALEAYEDAVEAYETASESYAECTAAEEELEAEKTEAEVVLADAQAVLTEAQAVTAAAEAALESYNSALSTYNSAVAALADAQAAYSEYLSTTGHTWDDGAVQTAATCYSTGVMLYTCTICGETKTETIDIVDHSFTNYVSNGDAECESDGTKTAYCDYGCGETDTVTDDGSATGHSYDSGVWTWEDYSKAVITFTCANDSGHVEVVEAQITIETDDAVCTEGGTIVYTAAATFDGETYTDTKTVETEALGHTEGEAVVENSVAATCDTAGSYDSVVYCTVCGEELLRETVTVAALGHTEAEAVKENVVDATCTDDGSYDSVVYCTVCGEELSRETVAVAALGHAYDYDEIEWVWAEDYSSAAATVTCDTDSTHILAAEVTVTSETTEATCEADAYTIYTATAVFTDGEETYTYSDTQKVTYSGTATGHDFATDEGSYDADWVDDEDGTYSVVFTLVCKNNSLHTTTITVDSAEGVITTAATCEEDGVMTYTATTEYNGVTLTAVLTEVIPATGHSYVGTVTTEPTETEAGVMMYTCTNDASHTYTETIASLGAVQELEDALADALEDLEAEADSEYAGNDVYEEALDAYQQAVKNAQDVLSAENVTSEDVADALKALEDAAEALGTVKAQLAAEEETSEEDADDDADDDDTAQAADTDAAKTSDPGVMFWILLMCAAATAAVMLLKRRRA